MPYFTYVSNNIIISNWWLVLTGYKNFNVKIERILNEKIQIILKVQNKTTNKEA